MIPKPDTWTLETHEHVRSVDWSRDKIHAAVALGDGRLMKINSLTGAVSCEREAHKGGVFHVEWSSSEDILATAGEDGFVRWWKGENLELLFERRPGGSWVEHLAWSPDGQLLAAASGKQLRIWDRQGIEVFAYSGHASTVTGIQWRGDGRGIGTASYGAVQLFRLGETVPYEPLIWKSSLLCMAWSPNGRHVCASTQENEIIYWRLPFNELKPLNMSGYPAKIRNLAWDPGSRYLVSDGGEVVTVWDVSGKGPAGTSPLQLEGHSGRVSKLVFRPQGEVLVSGCMQGEVWLWSPSHGEVGKRALDLGSEITGLKFDPDGNRLLVATAGGCVRLFF